MKRLFNFFKFHTGLAVGIVLVTLISTAFAAGLWNRGEHAIDAIWHHYQTQYFESGSKLQVESGAELQLDSGSTLDLVSGSVTAAHIADPTRTIYFDIGAAAVDSGNDVDDASAPNLTTLDNIPAILWDDSGETVGVQWTFPVPADYSSGMVVYAMVSSNDASGTGTKLDWALIKNADDTGFASLTAQDLVECTSATLDASNEILTLTPDATGAALFVDGAIITLELFNASTNDDDLELKAAWAEYVATQ